MSKDKEISATEKLLEMIRGEEDTPLTLVLEETDESAPDIEISSEPDNLIEPLSLESKSQEAYAPVINQGIFTASPSIKKSFRDETPQAALAETPKSGQSGPALDNSRDESAPALVRPASDADNPMARFGRGLFKNPLASIPISSKEQIGIDIQPDCINFAKLNISSPEPKLSNYLAVAIPGSGADDEGADLLFHRPEFTNTLSVNLASFCHNIKNPQIWCSFQSEKIQILNVTIPKVPPKEIANAVFWSTKKDADFDPAEYIYDFSIIKEVQDGKLQKIMTLVYLFPRKEVDLLKNIFKKIGYPLTGITHSSSAINNCLHHGILASDENPCVHLHFEKLKSHIDVYFQGAMLFTREIKTGINSYAESIFDLAAEEDLILDDQSAVEFAFDRTKDIITRPKDLTDDQAGEINILLDLKGLPATGRLVRQLNRTFDFCSTNFKVPRTTILFTSGPFTLKDEIIKEIKTEIDMGCIVVDIFKDDKENKTEGTLPQNSPKSLNPLTAFGLAAASNAITPNILFTFTDKKKHLQENRVNQIISVATIFLAIAVGTVFFFQYQSVNKKALVLKELTKELEQKYEAEPRSRDNSFALMATKKISETIKETSEKARRFTIIAMVKEVSSQVPKEIELTDLQIDMVQNDDEKKKKSRPEIEAEKKAVMSVTGFVTGKVPDQNFKLLNFQKDLNQIPLIEAADISSRKGTMHNDNMILYFTMKIDLKKDLF